MIPLNNPSNKTIQQGMHSAKLCTESHCIYTLIVSGGCYRGLHGLGLMVSHGGDSSSGICLRPSCDTGIFADYAINHMIKLSNSFNKAGPEKLDQKSLVILRVIISTRPRSGSFRLVAVSLESGLIFPAEFLQLRGVKQQRG